MTGNCRGGSLPEHLDTQTYLATLQRASNLPGAHPNLHLCLCSHCAQGPCRRRPPPPPHQEPTPWRNSASGSAGLPVQSAVPLLCDIKQMLWNVL